MVDKAILGESWATDFEMELELGGIAAEVTCGTGGGTFTYLLDELSGDSFCRWVDSGVSRRWGWGRRGSWSWSGRGSLCRWCTIIGETAVAVEEVMTLLFRSHHLSKR